MHVPDRPWVMLPIKRPPSLVRRLPPRRRWPRRCWSWTSMGTQAPHLRHSVLGRTQYPSFCQTRDRSRMPPQSAVNATASSAVNRSTIGSRCSAYGIPGESVTDVSQRLLAQHGGLRGLFRLDVAELAGCAGWAPPKPCASKPRSSLDGAGCPPPRGAASGRRAGGRGQPAQHRDGGTRAGAARVVLLDTKHRILGTCTVYQGSVNQKR